MNDLPDGWVETPLGSLCSVIRGVTFKKQESSAVPGEDLVPLITSTQISERGLNLKAHLSFVPAERVKPDQKLRRGDIIVAASSGSASVVGKSAMLTTNWPGTFGAFCAVIRPARSIEPAYLGFYVGSREVRRQWSALAAGTNINNLKREHLTDILVPLPPHREQQRIVAAIEEQLSRLDAADALLVAATKRLDLLWERTVGEATHGDWATVPLGNVAEIVGGVTKDAKRQNDPGLVEVPYLRVANIQRGFLDLNEVTMIRVPPAKAAALALRPGDVLFNEGGDRDKLGRGWVWSGEIEGCIHQNHVFRARLSERFDPRFVSWHGNTFGRSWFEAHGRQTTNLASLNLTTLRMFPVPDASLDEQVRIVAQIEEQTSVIDALRAATVRAGRRSESLRRSVLERAFAGDLVLQDRFDEPASALLDRIRLERAAAPEQRSDRKVRT